MRARPRIARLDSHSQEENGMIEILDGFPDNTGAVTAIGRVTRRDYDEILIPSATLARRPRTRT